MPNDAVCAMIAMQRRSLARASWRAPTAERRRPSGFSVRRRFSRHEHVEFVTLDPNIILAYGRLASRIGAVNIFDGNGRVGSGRAEII
ncbi:MAG: hypothetical protein WCC90_13225 [Methylocella sp.]